jgi:hypothetical protein
MLTVPTDEELMKLPTGTSIQRWLQQANPGISLEDSEKLRKESLRRIALLKHKS